MQVVDRNWLKTESAQPEVGPRHRDSVTATGRLIELRTLSRRDLGRLMAFARRLPSRARIALAIDLTNAAPPPGRMLAYDATSTRTLVAYQDQRVVGYASLRCDDAPWTRHVGEICIVVGSARQDADIGDCLGREMVARAADAGLRKITARTIDERATRAVFEQLGFFAEALLSDQVIDETGCTHDVLIMSRALECRASVDALAIVPRGQSEIGASNEDPPPRAERTPAAPWASVEVDLSFPTVNTDVAIAASASEISRNNDEAPPAEPVPVAVQAGGADAPPSDPGNGDELGDRRLRAAFVQVRARATPVRRIHAAAAVVAAVLVLVFGGVYLTTRHASSRDVQVLGVSARPATPSTFVPGGGFESTHTGSGGVFLPAMQPAIAVRVSLDPGVIGTWFWCFESSFGLPLAEHYCAAGPASESGPDKLVTQGAIRIDPAWPADAMYFVQMYCEDSCVWHVEMVSTP